MLWAVEQAAVPSVTLRQEGTLEGATTEGYCPIPTLCVEVAGGVAACIQE